MLTSCQRHNVALSSLIKTSMSKNFRNIPLVGISSYLDSLRKAVEHSDGYEGVQRKPLSWFKETGAGSYLSDLKGRKMSQKKRVFIIDSADEEQMQADLGDEDVKSYYWSQTGAVTTYWMTSSMNSIPKCSSLIFWAPTQVCVDCSMTSIGSPKTPLLSCMKFQCLNTSQAAP